MGEVTVAVSPLRHVFRHAALTGVDVDQHHLRPSNIPISNTALSVEPLPGGPGIWDVSVPFDAHLAILNLASGWIANDVGGKRGGRWMVTRVQYLEATGLSMGGPTAWQSGSYPGIFSKVASSLDLSHRIYTTAGQFVALTDAYLAATGSTTRVLRMTFTNYGAAYHTLTAYGSIVVKG